MEEDARRGPPRLVTEQTAGEELVRGYLGKILMLTLLAPDIVEGILVGRQSEGLTLPVLMKPFPVDWRHAMIS